MAILKHSETFRGESGIFFLLEGNGNVVLSNLPIQDVPMALMKQARSVEAQALLAVSAAAGYELQNVARSGHTVAFAHAAESFRKAFFMPPLEAGKTLVLSKADVSEWFKSQVIWRQDLTCPIGEER